eukprot:GHVU01054010.1.p1 GENE.GHVU01054010.1~~GHVU01054010.1.p1  ORF type:complete len:144 (+),score=16.94 GHVU01054010.1:471-902(+)
MGSGEPLCKSLNLLQQFILVPCWADAISTTMSLCVVAGAVVVRLPQIAKVIRTKNVHGIAESGLLLDFTSCAAFLSYNRLTGQPLLTYGETFFLFVQSLAQLLLYWQFSSSSSASSPPPYWCRRGCRRLSRTRSRATPANCRC